MSLQARLQPWSGFAVRHIPDVPGKNYDILDFRYCGKSNENRWNAAGESTLYLAREKDVALAEYARHFKVDRSPDLAAQTRRRKVFRFQVNLSATLDLCNPEVWSELSLTDAPQCFQSKSVARAIAHFIRNTTPAEAIFIPSMAFPDDMTQWCLAIFLEKLPDAPDTFISSVVEDSYFQLS